MQRPGKSLNRSDNIESFYCCTNFDKSTLFKKVLKADIDKKWCGSAGKLFHGSTTLLLERCLYRPTSMRVCTGNSLYV